MRLAVIADVHGNLVALQAVLAHAKRVGFDAMINLGDCVTSPLWPRETLELLESLKMPTVRGNHDRWLANASEPKRSRSITFTREALSEKQLMALGSLPSHEWINDEILAVHGTLQSDEQYLLESLHDGRLLPVTSATLGARLGDVSAEVVLCAHSHQQRAVVASPGRLVVNPGSVGCPRYADNEDPGAAEAGSPHARYSIVVKSGAGWSVESFVIDYDWSHVVQRAVGNDREDFARGFLWGYE